MFIFRFAIFNVAALIAIVFGTIKIIEDYDLNNFQLVLTLLIAVILFIKTYNYCFHWGSAPKDKPKKKKNNPFINFLKGINETFDYFFGWAVPWVVMFIFFTLLAWIIT